MNKGKKWDDLSAEEQDHATHYYGELSASKYSIAVWSGILACVFAWFYPAFTTSVGGIGTMLMIIGLLGFGKVGRARDEYAKFH